MKKECDLLIRNIGQLLTLAGDTPKRGEEMSNLAIVENAAVASKNGKIISVGREDKVIEEINLLKDSKKIDANHKVVIPGLIDCHTHLVFSGSREDEFYLRIEGKNYLNILKGGSGILSTVDKVRKASFENLIKNGIEVLNDMLSFGTTTVEIKSGYGLSIKDEIKILEVIKKLNEEHPIEIVSTFLGAHAFPEEYKNKEESYVNLIIEEMLPVVKEKNLAKFCDAFCGEDVFNLNQSEKILNAAKKLGYKLKIHADQLGYNGGAELAAKMGANSASHLEYISDEGISMMKQKNVIAELLPGSVFFMGKTNYAPARKMINDDVPITLATNYNPGTCAIKSLPIIMTLACIYMGMSAEEVITATTINAAGALGLQNDVGSIEVGKKSDMVIWDVDNYKQIPYYLGLNLVEKVIKNGNIVFEK
ncbi:MAG: imidazolonepropionase [Candidatus Humimicrobiia bacterium]